MRPPRPAMALLVLALAAPLATAQVPEGTPLEPVQRPLVLVAGPDVAEVRPNGGFASTNMSIQLHCTALAPQEPTTVDLVVESQPAWLVVSVSPAQVVFPPQVNSSEPGAPCVNEKRAQDVLVFVSANAQAPAFETGAFVVAGTVTGKEHSARAHFNATAGAFVQIEAAADATNGRATPDAPWHLNVTVTNRGNAPVAVDLATGAPAGLRVAATGGEVGTLAGGGASNQESFAVTVTPEPTLLDGRYPVWINATATVPGAEGVRAARGIVQVFVQVTGAAAPEGEDEKLLPAGALLAPLLAAAAAAGARRRRAQ